MLETSGKIYLALRPCDMRKQIDGLAAIVKTEFALDPFTESLFVFCNRNCDKIKILRWYNNGWGLYYRRLSRGAFRWRFDNESLVLEVSQRELRWLLDGLSLTQPEAHKPVKQRLFL